jgi:hypothetical protein
MAPALLWHGGALFGADACAPRPFVFCAASVFVAGFEPATPFATSALAIWTSSAPCTLWFILSPLLPKRPLHE